MESNRKAFSNYLSNLYMESSSEYVRLYDWENHYIDIVPVEVEAEVIEQTMEELDKADWWGIGLDVVDIAKTLYQNDTLSWYYMQWPDYDDNHDRIVAEIEAFLKEKKKSISRYFFWTAGVSMLEGSALASALVDAFMDDELLDDDDHVYDQCFQFIGHANQPPYVSIILGVE